VKKRALDLPYDGISVGGGHAQLFEVKIELDIFYWAVLQVS